MKAISEAISGPDLYDAMTSESIIGVVQHLAANGSIQTAARLLHVMKEPQAAKVLASLSIPHPTMATQLAEELRGLTR